MPNVTVPVSPALAAEHALAAEEFERIQKVLGRQPNLVELGIFSALWSEHCSYKSSRTFLKEFPTTGPNVLQGPGENAGAVDIGDGLAVVFKMESHNHPSFIEPYQGAATGVGGILRDVFDDEKAQRRPTVQVGDPFVEKLLLEAVLEVLEGDAVVAIQDMGAAGMTSSTFEMCARGGVGMRLDLSKVPMREKGMTPYELMLSESQERMVIVAHAGREEEVASEFRRWGV